MSTSLNGSQIKILETLVSGRRMSRKDIAEKTGIQKGYSKLLGAQENPSETALEPLGYVKSEEPNEGERGLQYTITAKGKVALEKAKKEAAESAKEDKKPKKKVADKDAETKAATKKAPVKKKKAAAASAE
jgi:DNA-binding MarR family transcriptional regulator